MINCTRLLAGTATTAEVIRHASHSPGKMPRHLLRYVKANAPMVVWNTTRGCNLACKHCYISANPTPEDGELNTEEAMVFISDLAAMGVPMLVFSGGEPLARPDIFELGRYAQSLGMNFILSSNGTLITPEAAAKIKASGFSYVGVSIDGAPETHDRFRGLEGSFDRVVDGIRNLKAAGIRLGVRFTASRYNLDDLIRVFDLVEREGVPRFSVFQLVYAGRGKEMQDWDIERRERRDLIEFIVHKTLEMHRQGLNTEIVTADNYADGIYLYNYVKSVDPARAEEVKTLLKMQSGCTAGDRLVNVDHLGQIHPCPYWQYLTLGNVREKPLSRFWAEPNPFLDRMRNKAGHLSGKCARCKMSQVCYGCRVRADVAYGDPLAEDPACYLTEDEISVGEVAINDQLLQAHN